MEELAKLWTLRGFLEHFRYIDNKVEDRSFCFILGAGASRSSGIPTGSELAYKWLAELHNQLCHDNLPVEKWAVEGNLGIVEFDYNIANEFYPHIFGKRFQDDIALGYAYLQNEMEGKEPSLGYSILAQVLSKTRHRVVITTNFDNLISDSLSIYSDKYPFVCGHESLTSYIQARLRRPLIAKIHRDLYLAPMNTESEMNALDQKWENVLKRLFKDYCPVVIGYGGNDGTLMGLLERLECGDIQGGIFWCYRVEDKFPCERICRVVSKHKGVFVPIFGFDEFMLQMGNLLEYPMQADALQERAKKRAQDYKRQWDKLVPTIIDSSVRETVDTTIERSSGWMKWMVLANAEKNPHKKMRIYREGVREHPNSVELIGEYAKFLYSRHYYVEAKRFFERAVELGLEDGFVLSAYADYLADVECNYDLAETYYRRSVKLKDADSMHFIDYGDFLLLKRKDVDGAREKYKRAVEAYPRDGYALAKYAMFCLEDEGDVDETEEMLKRALACDPTDSYVIMDYAEFLANHKGDVSGAEKLYLRAVELRGDNPFPCFNYAQFLIDHYRNLDQAEKMYRDSLRTSSYDAYSRYRYAEFLLNFKEDLNRANHYFKEAVGGDTRNVRYLRDYAFFLFNHKLQFERAERLFRRALSIRSDDASLISCYANYLIYVKSDFEHAKSLVNEAFEREPDNDELRRIYVELHAYRGQDHDVIDKLLKDRVDSEASLSFEEYADFKMIVHGDYSQAEYYYGKALEINAEDPEVHAKMAYLKIMTDRIDDAFIHAESAAKINSCTLNYVSAHILMYLLIISRIRHESSDLTLRWLKYLLIYGYKRQYWPIENIINKISDWKDDVERTSYLDLCVVISNLKQNDILEKYEWWHIIEPTPLFMCE